MDTVYPVGAKKEARQSAALPAGTAFAETVTVPPVDSARTAAPPAPNPLHNSRTLLFATSAIAARTPGLLTFALREARRSVMAAPDVCAESASPVVGFGVQLPLTVSIAVSPNAASPSFTENCAPSWAPKATCVSVACSV
jgi:hypothetical protein